MPEQPFTDFVLCSICNERPGTLHMVVATDNGRQGAVMCESCARDLMDGFGQAGFGPASEGTPSFGQPMPFGPGRGPAGTQTRRRADQRQKSDTPALDEFG